MRIEMKLHALISTCPCGEALLPDNSTGLCAECRYLAGQDVIVRELDRLGGAAS